MCAEGKIKHLEQQNKTVTAKVLKLGRKLQKSKLRSGVCLSVCVCVCCVNVHVPCVQSSQPPTPSLTLFTLPPSGTAP